MMIVYVYPQSLVYRPIEPSSTLRVSHPLQWHHHAWASNAGDAIERHNMLTVKERKKSTKRKKENIIIYYINY